MNPPLSLLGRIGARKSCRTNTAGLCLPTFREKSTHHEWIASLDEKRQRRDRIRNIFVKVVSCSELARRTSYEAGATDLDFIWAPMAHSRDKWLHSGFRSDSWHKYAHRKRPCRRAQRRWWTLRTGGDDRCQRPVPSESSAGTISRSCIRSVI